VNFRDLKLRIQQFVPELNVITIGFQINKRYQRILKQWHWSFLKSEAILTTVAPYSTGTVTVTNGSKTVTGSGTNWTLAMAGRQFRIDSAHAYYEIDTIDSATQLTLKYAYGGDSGSGKSYKIFQNIYSLASDVKEISSIVYNYLMRQKDAYFLDRYDAERSSTGVPEWWIYRGRDANGYQQIEIYPVPDDAYEIRYRYYKKVSNLSADTDEPLCREDLLEMGALVDCYRLMISKVRNAVEKLSYTRLMQDAQREYQQLLYEAIEEDIRVESQRETVSDVYEPISYSDTFRASHDIHYWEVM